MDGKQDTTHRVTEVITALIRLGDVLARENEAVRGRRTADVRALADEKAVTCRTYEAKAQALRERLEALPEVDTDLRLRLRGLGEKAAVLMRENEMLLRAAIEANRRVMEAVSEAARSLQAGAGTYSPRGITKQGRGAPTTRPLTVNQAL